MTAAKAAPAAKGAQADPVDQDEAEDSILATVAHGRTVVDAEGLKRAGEIVLVSAEEYAALLSTGFLVDPETPPPPRANGPTFSRRG